MDPQYLFEATQILESHYCCFSVKLFFFFMLLYLYIPWCIRGIPAVMRTDNAEADTGRPLAAPSWLQTGNFNKLMESMKFGNC